VSKHEMGRALLSHAIHTSRSTPAHFHADDNNGNTLTKALSSTTTAYTWDYENRLTQVTLPGSGGTVTFKYDPFGRRIYKSSSSGTSIFAYDGDNMVEETNASGSVVGRYSQGLNIDEPLAELRSGSTSYYEADWLGSITSLTSTAGAVAQNYTYDSFGNIIATSGSIVNNFRYTGREWDTETSLYYYRARYYDPQVGRFPSEDPIRTEGGINFYRYTLDSPVNLADPSGLIPCEQKIRNLLNGLLGTPCQPTPFSNPGSPVGQQNGSHQKYTFASTPLSPTDVTNAHKVLTNPAYGKPFGPCCRIPGTGLHVENPIATPVSDSDEQTIQVTVHIDIGNPNAGLGGLLKHILVDGGTGHLEDLLNMLLKTNLNLDLHCDQ
jgi:RHS repeat-associated protein